MCQFRGCEESGRLIHSQRGVPETKSSKKTKTGISRILARVRYTLPVTGPGVYSCVLSAKTSTNAIQTKNRLHATHSQKSVCGIGGPRLTGRFSPALKTTRVARQYGMGVVGSRDASSDRQLRLKVNWRPVSLASGRK